MVVWRYKIQVYCHVSRIIKLLVLRPCEQLMKIVSCNGYFYIIWCPNILQSNKFQEFIIAEFSTVWAELRLVNDND